MFLVSLLSTPAVDVFEPIAKWLTIALAAAALLTGAILFFVKKDLFGKYAKCALLSLFFYLLALAITFFALDIAKHYSQAYIEENWLDKQALIAYLLAPLLVFASVTLLCATAFVLVSKYKPNAKKTVAIVGACLCVLALVYTLVCLTVYYNKKIANDGYYNSEAASVKQLALYLGALLTVAIIVGLSLFDKQKFQFDARTLAYAGICVSMSFALSYIKLWDMPQGGSVTLVSLLPIMLFSYLFGAKRGVFVGFTYGVLQAVQDPWLIHPAQFLLDYPVAFAAAGLAGLFGGATKLEKLPQAQFTLGACLAGVLRFICHVLSGVFAFEASAEGQNVWLYSLGYNAYVFIDVALVIAAGVFVLSSKAFINAVRKTQKTAQ
ncbi:MAG: energy-coupled thiamine transporter ThiT [Clostridia bacterium]|nr:energy-coupled thiamine transporter ThiT [Clostridia bacterium]